MDWSQLTPLVSGIVPMVVTIVGAVMWLDARINQLNGKSEARQEKIVKEWRDEHKSQMEKMDKSIEKNETHWREMFLYMNGKLDKLAERK